MFRLGFIYDLKTFWTRQSRNFKVLLARDIISTLVGVMYGPYGGGGGGAYGSIFLRKLGAGTVEIGLVSSISSFVNMILSIPLGLLTDRVKRLKRLYLVGHLLALPVNLVEGFASTWQMVLGSRIWGTMTMRLSQPVMEIISIDSLQNKDRARGIALTRMVTSSVGLFSPILLAHVINYYGGLDRAPDSLRPLYVLQFGVSLLTFIVFLLWLQEPKVDRGESRAGFLASSMELFRGVPGTWRLLFLNGLNSLMMGIRFPFIQLYFYEIKKADVFIIGWQGTVTTAVSLVLSVPMSQLADHFGRRKLSYIGHVVFALCVLSAILVPPTNPELLLVYSFLSGLGTTMEIGWWAFQQEYIPLQYRGRWVGLNTLVNAMVNIPAPFLGGLIWNIAPDIAWWLGVINYAFVALPLMMSIPEKKKSEDS